MGTPLDLNQLLARASSIDVISVAGVWYERQLQYVPLQVHPTVFHPDSSAHWSVPDSSSGSCSLNWTSTVRSPYLELQ